MRIELLTVKDVADALKLHPQTVRRMIARGELPATKIRGRVRVETQELLAFVRKGSAARAVTTPLQMITPPQLRALHAKADRADRLNEWPRLTAKKRVMTEASEHFRCELASASDLDELQASWVMERLDELAEHALAPATEIPAGQ